MPKLIRLYIQQVAIGFGIAGLFVAMLLYFNVGNLWSLVSNSEDGVLAVFMLFMLNGIVFAGVQFGIAVMRLGTEETDDDDDVRGTRDPIAIPVETRVPPVHRHR